MPTRYQQLRQAIARLASSADEQHAYLESILGWMSGDGSVGYGNDELALEFGDIYLAVGHMHDWGEITNEEIKAAKPLDDLLTKWSGAENADFWRREALWTDPRWQEVRQCAQQVLMVFPDEERPSDRLATLANSETQSSVDELAQQTWDRGRVQAFYARLVACAFGLAALAIAIVSIEPGAPASLLEGRGIYLLLLLFLAPGASAIRALVERRRGEAPLSGPWWAVMRPTVLLQLALLVALPALGLLTALMWAVGGRWVDLLWQAWLTLLVGGACVGMAGSLVANLLFLLLPRRR